MDVIKASPLEGLTVNEIVLLLRQKLSGGFYGMRGENVDLLDRPFVTIYAEHTIRLLVTLLSERALSPQHLERILVDLQEDLWQMYHFCSNNLFIESLENEVIRLKSHHRVGLQFSTPVYGNDEDAMKVELRREMSFIAVNMPCAIRALDSIKSAYIKEDVDAFAVALNDFIRYTKRTLRLDEEMIYELRAKLSQYLSSETEMAVSNSWLEL